MITEWCTYAMRQKRTHTLFYGLQANILIVFMQIELELEIKITSQLHIRKYSFQNNLIALFWKIAIFSKFVVKPFPLASSDGTSLVNNFLCFL